MTKTVSVSRHCLSSSYLIPKINYCRGTNACRPQNASDQQSPAGSGSQQSPPNHYPAQRYDQNHPKERPRKDPPLEKPSPAANRFLSSRTYVQNLPTDPFQWNCISDS